jgi:co-chaperonin GroES (HSP10)
MNTTVDKIRPIHNHIIIKFLDVSGGGEFTSTARSGIALASMSDEQGAPRWAQVVKRGPDVDEEIQVGTFVLIEPKMWSVGVMLDDDKRFWRTDSTHVMAVADEALHRY